MRGQARAKVPLPNSTCPGLGSILAFAPHDGCHQGCVRASSLWSAAGRLSLWPVETSPSLIFHLSRGLAPVRSALMWGLLPGEKSRVSEGQSGLCPLPPAQAGPRGLPAIKARQTPRVTSAARARALGLDLQADGGAAAPKGRRRLRSKSFVSTLCNLFLYLSPPRGCEHNNDSSSSVLACQPSTRHEAERLPFITPFSPYNCVPWVSFQRGGN